MGRELVENCSRIKMEDGHTMTLMSLRWGAAGSQSSPDCTGLINPSPLHVICISAMGGFGDTDISTQHIRWVLHLTAWTHIMGWPRLWPESLPPSPSYPDATVDSKFCTSTALPSDTATQFPLNWAWCRFPPSDTTMGRTCLLCLIQLPKQRTREWLEYEFLRVHAGAILFPDAARVEWQEIGQQSSNCCIDGTPHNWSVSDGCQCLNTDVFPLSEYHPNDRSVEALSYSWWTDRTKDSSLTWDESANWGFKT